MHFLSSSVARRGWCLVLLAALLSACGGGDESAEDSQVPEVPVTPIPAERAGKLESATLLGTVRMQDIADAISDKDAPSLAQDVVPRYDVKSYRLEYLTADADGREVRASGLVSVPLKPAGAASPVLSYQHGTIFRDEEAPSNQGMEPSEVAVVMASLGYIVLAPDYVGFGASKGTPHPYLLAEPAAAATVDFLTAARTWRREAGVRDNDQLFLTGYSEGGYVTMAAHRALQAQRSPHLAQLRMVVPGAGPYDVQATMDGLVDIVRKENQLIGALINPGFLRHLGGSVQREVRRLLLRALIPDDADVRYDTRFIDRFLADDVQTIAAVSSVYNWKPEVPVHLYHGRDDRTVPYASSTSALRAMRAQGASDLVSLTDCRAEPAGHMQCVTPFISFMLGNLATVARDL